MPGPAFLIPAGDWAGWVGSFGATAALFFAFVQLRSERKKDRDAINRDHENTERAQASLVAGWMHKVVFKQNNSDFTQLVLRIRNGSELPVYNMTISAEVGVRGKFYRALGALAPHETRELTILLPAPPRSSEVTPSLFFLDVAGRTWYRSAQGNLRNPSEGDRNYHFETKPGAYVNREDHPTLNLPLSYDEQRGRKVDD